LPAPTTISEILLSFSVILYPVIGLPPLLRFGSQVRVALPEIDVAETAKGAGGTETAVAFTIGAGVVVPSRAMAVTLMEYSIPPLSPARIETQLYWLSHVAALEKLLSAESVAETE
jgi:hypothetical protein